MLCDRHSGYLRQFSNGLLISVGAPQLVASSVCAGGPRRLAHALAPIDRQWRAGASAALPESSRAYAGGRDCSHQAGRGIHDRSYRRVPAAVESTRCTQQKTARRRPLSKSEIMRSQVMPPALFGVAKQAVRLVPSSDRANLHQRLGRGLLPC